MKAYWGSGGVAPRILDLGTRWRWVVSFTPQPLYPQGKSPGTHWIGGWVGPRAVLDAVVKRKIPSPRRESNPRTPIIQSVSQRYTDWAITVLLRIHTFSEFWTGTGKTAGSVNEDQTLLTETFSQRGVETLGSSIRVFYSQLIRQQFRLR
jgi:hypothetical protein